jgi:diguanylate cyclase (GGDEF)-like protein/PAS domain S-box-containing protein
VSSKKGQRESRHPAHRSAGPPDLREDLLHAADLLEEGLLLLEEGGKVLHANAAAARCLGLPAAELLGTDIGRLADSAPPEEALHLLKGLLAAGEEFSGESVHTQPDGEAVHLVLSLTRLRPPGSSGAAFALLAKDVTHARRAEEQILHDAFLDALTGLPNRALFLDRMGQSLARSRRTEEARFAILLMDLDRFKVVNDSLGHQAGDRVLQGIAHRLKACLRPADTVSRLGGDEFGLLIEDVREGRDALLFAERLHKALLEPFTLEGQEVFTAASIGVALGTPAYENAEELLRDADTALNRAKAQGKSRSVLFDPTMHQSAVALFQMETDLRRSVENGHFRVYYQPIVSLKTGRTAGFEALVRWQHPRRGLVWPAEFIGLAEETGLIIPIGHFVLKEAIKQLRSWQSKYPRTPPLLMSVNLSGIQFLRPELTTHLDLTLREYGVEGATVKLELTESVIMEHAEYARDMMAQMKAQNVKLCVDDFGTGYSSMSYLRRYPIDTVKIDKSFISKMDSDPESLEIVRTVVTMAHNLGKEVIAEGLETREQLAKVKALKVEYAQGFFFSKAVDRESAESLVTWRWFW